MAVTTGNAVLTVKKDGKDLLASRVHFYSRSAGAYLEADLSTKSGVRIGDELQVYFKDEESEFLLATVEIYGVPCRSRGFRILASDVYRDNLKTVVKPAGWKDASLKEIAEDVIAECDIDKYDLSSLPALKLLHFSYHNKNGMTILNMLSEAAYEVDNSLVDILPATDGTLMYGTELVPEAEWSLDIDSQKVMLSGDDHFIFSLLPMLHGQTFKVQGQEYLADIVDIIATPIRKETKIWM